MNSRRLKKALAFALVLCMAIGVGPALAQENAAPPSQLFASRLLDDWKRVNSMVLLDGTAYMLTDTALYTWREGEREAIYAAEIPPELYGSAQPVERVTALFIREGKLMGLDGTKGFIYKLSLEGDRLRYEKILALDWSDFDRSEGGHVYYISPGRIVYDNGLLYVSFDNWDGSMASDLYSFDAQTGAMKKYSPTHLKGLVPYRDGKLLGLYFDQNKTDPDTFEQIPAQPVIFDPEADSTQPAPLRLPQPGRHDSNQNLLLYTEPASGSIYAASDTALFRLSENTEPVLTGRLPMADSWGGSGMSPSILPFKEDQLLIAYGSNVFLRSMDESKLAPVITLKTNGDFFGSQSLTKTLLQMDDIVLDIYSGDWQDSSVINGLFLSGGMEYDILSFSHGQYDPQKMVEKGYFASLGDVPGLMAFAEDVFDLFDPFISKDGETHLLPTRLDTYYPAAYSENFKAVGAALPSSVPELLELVRWWAEHHNQFEGYVLFEDPDAKRLLKDMAYTAYVDQALGEGTPLQFDMEHFGQVMQAIDQLDVSGFDIKREELEEEYFMVEGKALIMGGGMGYDIRNTEDAYYALMELSFDGTTTAWRNANTSYLGIPSTSKNQEAAKRFLSAYFDNMAPEERAALSKTWDEPIPNPRYDEEYASQLQSLEQYETLAAKSSGAEKTQYEQDVAYMKAQVERFEEEGKYTVSTEALRHHKDLMSRVYLPGSLGIVQRNALNTSSDGRFLPYMYFDGAITLGQFIEEVNGKIRLMTLEAQ